MKQHLPISLIVLISLVILSGCEIIGDIFQTGVGVGIFITVAILLVILYIVGRIRRR